MRIWSIHPSFLDQKGLCGLWVESLLAQYVLIQGEFKPHFQTPHTRLMRTPYYNHPQLTRFKKCKYPIQYIGWYLFEIYEEAYKRGYNFDKKKIVDCDYTGLNYLTVTKGQLQFEFEHLRHKLFERKSEKAMDVRQILYQNCVMKSEYANPVFRVIDGQIESWEKIK